MARVSEPVLAPRDPPAALLAGSSAELHTTRPNCPDKIHPQRLSSLMGASGCGPPQERSAIPFTFAGYGADRSVMRGDHLRALDVALSADLRQRPGLPCGLSP